MSLSQYLVWAAFNFEDVDIKTAVKDAIRDLNSY